jgi:hypothetical protein
LRIVLFNFFIGIYKKEMDKELFNAVRQNNLNRVRELIENGANIEGSDDINGTTHLMGAVKLDRPDMVRLLVELGANIERRNNIGYTALDFAVFSNNAEMVRLLVELGANIQTRDYSGFNTALMNAAIWDKTEMIRLLVELGANIEATNNFGETIIDFLTIQDDQPMIDLIRKAVRTREIKEKNAKIRAQKMSFYTSLIKSEDLPRNESTPLSGLYSGIDYNPYIARHIADFAFGEEENEEDAEEGAEESKRTDSGGRRRKSLRKKSKRKSGARKKSKRKSKSKRRKSRPRK